MSKSKQKKNTRQAIIDAAGELFALRGLDGTGVRAIVKSAGTALSSVNYHFENKEQLYRECIRYVLHDQLDLEAVLLPLDDDSPLSLQEISNLLYSMVRKTYFLLLNPENPNWYGILLLRARQETHSIAQDILASITDPERVKVFLQKHITDLDDKEAYLWVFNMFAQVQYFVISKPTVLKSIGKQEYDSGIIEMIARSTTINLLRTLNLPEPEKMTP